MLFDQEVRMGESIDFQYPMKAACASGREALSVYPRFPKALLVVGLRAPGW